VHLQAEVVEFGTLGSERLSGRGEIAQGSVLIFKRFWVLNLASGQHLSRNDETCASTSCCCIEATRASSSLELNSAE
jgi:hypothetical protein